jgi:16S rRNA (guanine(966)-N(2))-methyltransferase RsmD
VTRIVAGTRGGRRIGTPPGRDTRPTSDRVREGLFSTLSAVTDLQDSRFVDLYAGSGAVGLEAASRGASAVLLVESDARAARIVRENIAALGLGQVCQLSAARVATALADSPGEPFDIVFADPPYAMDDQEIARMLTALVERPWLTADAWVVVERSTRSPEPLWPEGVTPDRSRRYGESLLWYGRRS